MATKAPKLGLPVQSGGLVPVDDDPNQYLQQSWVRPTPVAPEQAKPRTWGQAASDTGVALLQGGAGLVKSAGDLYGLAAGDMQNPVSELGANAQEYWQEQKSPQLREKMAQRDADIASKDTVLGKAGTALYDTVTEPALAMDTVAGNAATMLPGAVVGRAAAGAKMARALSVGPLSEAAMGAAAKTAGKVGTAAAIAAGGVQQGADVSSNIFDQSMKKPDEVWNQNPDFVARVQALGGDTPENRQQAKTEISTSAARATFIPATAVSLIANSKIPGADMLERVLVGGAAKETIKQGTKYAIPKAMMKAALGEAAQETIEEGGGQFAGNIAAQKFVDPNQNLGEQVGENAGMGAAGGFLMGAGGGAFHGQHPHVEEKGPLSRAANTGIDAGATPPPVVPPAPVAVSKEQAAQLLAIANVRAKLIDDAANGTKEEEVPGPDGKPMTLPGVAKRFLTPEEKAERDFLAEHGGDVQMLAQAYPGALAQPTPDAAPIAQTEQSPLQAPATAGLSSASGPTKEDLPKPTAEAFDQREKDRPAEPTGAVQDGDILNTVGKPFKNMAAAMTAHGKAGKDTHEIVRVAGGLVVRPNQSTQQEQASGKDTAQGSGAATQAGEAPAQKAPKAGTSATQANLATRAGSDTVEGVGVNPASLSTVDSDKPQSIDVVDDKAHAAATSPNNDLPEPTDAQKEAGNYQKGHVSIGGLDLAIENPQGSKRSGVDRDGKAWENTLQHHYGYIKGTIGNDKDHVDAFVKPGTAVDHAGTVFVVDQVHPDTGKFDEHKALIGFDTMEEAKAAYHANYAKGWKGLKAVSAMPFAEFKAWVKDGPKTAPLAPVNVEDVKAKHEATKVHDRETIPVASNKHGVVQSEINVAQLPNGKWVSSHSWTTSTEGVAHPLRNDSKHFDSRDDAINAAIDEAVARIKDDSLKAKWEAARPKKAEAPGENAEWTRMPHAERLAVTTRAGMAKLVADKIARTAWADITPKTRERITAAMQAPETGSVTTEVPENVPKTGEDVPKEGTTAKANTIFTEEAAAAARAVLKKKLGQLNSGIDPELLQAGMTLAGYHIEKGARTFAAYAKAMLADLGDSVKPYLKSWYNALRDYPGFDASGMTEYSVVSTTDLEVMLREVGDSGLSQPASDGVPMVAGLFTDLPERNTLIEKGFDSLNVAQQRSVLTQMGLGLQNDKVFDSIVQSIPVDVVNMLIGKKFSSEDLLSNKSVLMNALSIPSDSPIPVPVIRFIDSVATLAFGKGALSTTEGSTRSGNIGGSSVSSGSTSNAGDGRQDDSSGVDNNGTSFNYEPQPAIVEHITGKGKTLRGVVRTDLTLDQAKAIDKYTFKKDGGLFIREEHLDALNAAHPQATAKDEIKALNELADAPVIPDAISDDKGDARINGPYVEMQMFSEAESAFVNAVVSRIVTGEGFSTIVQARKLWTEATGQDYNQSMQKRVDELVELGVVLVGRDRMRAYRELDQSVPLEARRQAMFQNLVSLYGKQPVLGTRTSTSIEQQAYSTPLPLAFVASELSGVTLDTTVYEPTAGNGMLAIGANPTNVIANELNGDRHRALSILDFAVVTQKDATEYVPYDKVDVVQTNPPFGPIKDKEGNSIKVKVDGYTLGQIDHLIAARALQAMKDDGRATLIIGANKVTGEQSNNDLIFFNWLYGNYHVTSHFEVDGDLYQRQGAAWPVRVITIEGRKKSSTFAPAPGTIQRANTWSEVYERFQQGLGAQQPTEQPSSGPVSAQSGPNTNGTRSVSVPADTKAGQSDSGRPQGGTQRNGNVGGAGTGNVLNSPTGTDNGVGKRDSSGGNPDAGAGTSAAKPGDSGGAATTKSATNSGGSALADAENQFQTKYVPRSSRKDEGVLIPVNMAGPTQDALNRLEDEVGDIDEYARTELGYKSVKEMHDALMGLQVDSVASAIYQNKNGKGVIIADQTGIGKGRQAAAVIRWAAKNGKTPIFVTVKGSLFTAMHEDLHDIGSYDIAPFILNKDEYITGKDDEKLFANRASTHTAVMTKIANTGQLPNGSNALFTTYSQINKENIQRKVLMALAENAVFVLDESHNAGGDSSTGNFVRDVLSLASGVTYLSATYAKRPDNMPVYFKTDIGEATADNDALKQAMAMGGLPLQTVVANNLVKAGQMFRRERSYDGVSIESRADTAHRDEHVKLSDTTTSALRAIVAADSAFHHNYVKSLQKELEKEGSRVLDEAGNQAKASVDHTQFSSVVHNFVRQMLLGLKAQEAADDAIRSLKRGEKPLIAVENTMGSFLNEYAENNGLSVGDALGSFTYRTVLSRALERSRYIIRQLPNGDKVKEYIPLSQLDPVSYEAYAHAQDVIDGLQIDIPVSPIDWMRNEITKAGYTVAEVTGRNLSVDYSDPKNPKLSQLDIKEQEDKVRTTRLFNSGKLDALVLNVAGSTGISLHSSDKFADQRQRHMIVAQAAQDINIFMQMLGRIHRTGQVNLPKYTLLSADLPAEIRPTALLSGKMKSLNANTSSNTESATSVKATDMLNKYGDKVVGQYLIDNPELADALGLETPSENGDGSEDIARKATGRLALMPVKVQEQFYADVQEQYDTLIEYLNKTNQNELEPKTFDFDAKETKSEILFQGQNKNSPFGEDATYAEYSVKAQGKAMTPAEIKAAMAENLDGLSPKEHLKKNFQPLYDAAKKYVSALPEAQQAGASVAMQKSSLFVQDHPIGSMFRVDINGENYNAIITNIRNTHKTSGNPFALSKFQVTIAVNGALRSVTVPATQFSQIQISGISDYGSSVEREFKVGPPNERETAKIVTGNLLGAYGELDGTRGAIIAFTKADGSIEQGILLPKTFNFAKDVRQDYRLKTPSDAYTFLTNSTNENIERFGINSRDATLRVSPSGRDSITIQVPKSKAKGGKYFLDKALLATTGDFTSQGNYMRATVEGKAASVAALEVLMNKQALYALPSMAEEARDILGDPLPTSTPGPTPDAPTAFSRNSERVQPGGQPRAQVEQLTKLISERWANAPEIVVVQNLNDPRIPQEIKDEAKGLQSSDDAGAPDGFYDKKTNRVYLIADKLRGDADVVRVLMHESLGHYGLRGLYGAQLGTILDRMAVLNTAKVRSAAKTLGLDYEKTSERRMAAEEVLAYMAQHTPELGWVRKTVAAVRSWLRENIPGFSKMKFSDDELIRNFIIPARNWVENGNPTGPKGGNTSTPTPFSRNLGDALSQSMNSVKDVSLPAGYKVADLFEGAGRLHWWHKSVGTMYHLAQKSPEFKKVYDSIQSFLNDVSYYAAEAADMAPNILPKLDKIGDVFKSPLSPEDTKALSAPVFQGTLSWGRDKNGKAAPMEDIEAQLGATALDDKAHMLVRAGHIDPKVLRMWQGLPQDQYEGIINGKFEKEFMKPGVVFTPAELREHFGLTDAQVALYQEFRKATDKSIDQLAISDMLNHAGADVAPIKSDVMEMTDVSEAAQTLRDYLVSQAELQPERDSVLSDTAAKMLDVAAHASDMKERGYAPLSRFGTFTLEATLDTGERYFSMFETDRERNKAARMLTSAGATGIKTGTMSQEAYKLFNGISPETAALFGEILGLNQTGNEEQDVAFQEYIKRATSNRSAMKRLLKRKGIAGFSEDTGRVLAGFIYSNARKTSGNLHTKETSSAVNDIPKEQGELKDTAVKLQQYVSDPTEEATGFRGILFAQYLGGSVASAMVNATQPFAVTLPYLSQFGGIRKAAVQMAAAARDATKDQTGNLRLDAALKKAEEEGIVSPQEVHALQAQASGRAQLRSGDGTLTGNALAKGSNVLSKLSLAWGKVFGVAEQFNRRVTFIAAYRTAVEQGINNPDEFAAKAVAETQFTYNKGNKPRWARGAVGSVLFTFKQYSVNYLELVTRMATAGEPGSAERIAGQKAAVFAIAILFMMAGSDGLPFMEDIEDVIDAAMQRLGYNFSSKQAIKSFLAAQLGKDGAEFVTNGVSGLPGMPLDVSGRLGMGNLIPGTGLLQKKASHTSDLLELAGPAGDFAKRTLTAAEQAAGGNVSKAINTMAPQAARNVTKAIDMADTGMYRDDKGRKVIDATAGEAALKAIGFQPRSVKNVQDAAGEAQKMRGQYTIAASEVRAKMAQAIFMNDEDMKQSARGDLAAWNRNNPDQHMSIDMPSVLRQVKEMRKGKEQRMAETAPKAIRAQVRSQLKEELH